MTAENELLERARKIHDEEDRCRCDSKYIRSCSRFTAAILKASQRRGEA